MRKERGFTIIELMFATIVFSVILLLCIGAIVQVGRMYYKGISVQRTQEVTRTIMDDVSREVQFSGRSIIPIYSAPSGGAPGCLSLGSKAYRFVLNTQLQASGNFVLQKLSDTGSDTCPDPNDNSLWANALEMTSVGMRLTAFEVTPLIVSGGTTAAWAVVVDVLYGDDDVLMDDAGNPAPPYTQCRGNVIGTQFCARSQLQTTVIKRVVQ
jgi:prepilin-type N-terminal cleavage/methylation domain-containing protein